MLPVVMWLAVSSVLEFQVRCQIDYSSLWSQLASLLYSHVISWFLFAGPSNDTRVYLPTLHSRRVETYCRGLCGQYQIRWCEKDGGNVKKRVDLFSDQQGGPNHTYVQTLFSNYRTIIFSQLNIKYLCTTSMRLIFMNNY